MTACVRYRIMGRVQGVSFRFATRQRAVELGVTGWVRNLPDGCVEVLACGTPQQLDSLAEWLWRGPPLARVADVQQQTVPLERHIGFAIV